MANRSNAARKANETRAARKAFYAKYPETAYIAETVLREESGNWRNFRTRGQLSSRARVAAVKANLNRFGNYALMAAYCNW